ncbi:MAG TPA: M48 family metallopeptidase, partial [Acidimicrobiales bacterium]|nr:M48 family metallopeptidase [Acidimicrobiales bacterium]
MTLPFHSQPELLPDGDDYLLDGSSTESPNWTEKPAGPAVDRAGPAVDRAGPAVDPAGPKVEVRHSTRRRKTAAARWEGDRVVVLAPNWLRGAELDEMVDHLVGRILKQRPHLHASDQFLMDRAVELADRYLEGVRPSSIRWSSRQQMRWGSCTVTTREIRIAERLRPVPSWVLDSVIVHELA